MGWTALCEGFKSHDSVRGLSRHESLIAYNVGHLVFDNLHVVSPLGLVIPPHQSGPARWYRCLLDSDAISDMERTDSTVVLLHLTCDGDFGVYTCWDRRVNYPGGDELDETDRLRMIQASIA